MDNNDTQINKTTVPSQLELLSNASKVAIFLKDEPSFDEVVSALALNNFLETNGKRSRIICSLVPDYLKTIEGVEKIETSLGLPTLVISFDYVEGDIEKISYKVDQAKFNLVINSKKGIDPKKLEFETKASELDLVIFLGLTKQEQPALFEKYPTLRDIENLESKEMFFVSDLGIPIVEQLVKFFVNSKMKVSPKAAEWLFSGLKSAMNNFADPISATAFESAAQCVRWIKNQDEQNAPESWLTPKIYKGSTIVE